jgi:enoyl-CoA hydratase/carnithine racemase
MQFCRYEKKDHVAYITITRPEVMNALHAHASREMGEVFDDFAADNDSWVAVLTGEGEKAFSAGNDL